MLKTVVALATIAMVATSSTARSDECDAVIGELAATISGLDIGERVTSPDKSAVIALKQAAADDMKLICPPGAQQPNQIDVAWHSAFPPPAYFDLLAAAGAVVTTNSTAVVRKGALICQKQALTADIENAQIDLAGVHFQCSVFTHNGGRIEITVFSRRNEVVSAPKAPSDDAPAEKSLAKKTTPKKQRSAQ